MAAGSIQAAKPEKVTLILIFPQLPDGGGASAGNRRAR
jgi:hypothetical protein